MKRLLTSAIALALGIAAGTAHAADKVTLQLKWVTQAQFAGYYVALDKGFYKDAGLDVTIKAGGPDIAPAQVIAGGGADVVLDWMPSALASREKGLSLVNIAQPFKSSGMMLTCRKDKGIASTADLAGKTLGVWFFGNEYPFLSWMNALGIPTDGSAGGVTVLKQGFNVDPLLQKQADCVSTMTYNEYWQVVDAGVKPDQLEELRPCLEKFVPVVQQAIVAFATSPDRANAIIVDAVKQVAGRLALRYSDDMNDRVDQIVAERESAHQMRSQSSPLKRISFAKTRTSL